MSTLKYWNGTEWVYAIVGAQGPAGADGVGIPSGGNDGQVLQKLGATDYAVQWADLSSLNSTATQVHVYVKNGSGQALTKGQAVYINGAVGANPTITLAQANSEATSSKTLGLLEQNLANNAFGYVATEGLLTSLDTGTAQDGDPVWLSGTTAGGLIYGIANKPSAPTHLVFIGYVLRAQQNNGVIYVKPQNGFELQELHNVAISSPATGQSIVYNSSTSLWNNGAPVPASHQSSHQVSGADTLLMGTPTAGSLTSNAVTMTTSTPVINGVAQLNEVLGLLVPAQPPTYPNGVTSTVGAQYRIAVATGSQTTNGNSSITQAIGTTIYATFANTFTTSTSSGTGSGTTGTITIDRNVTTGVVTKVLNSTDNTGTTAGTNASLVISANPSYGTPSGFWKTLTMYATGTTVPSGWNRIKINHSQTGTPTSSTADWYYDSNNIGVPTVTPNSITVPSSTTNYSSGIPHYATATFNLNTTLLKLIGDTYPTSNTFLTTNATGVFGAGSRTYSQASVTIGQNEPATSLAVATPVSLTASGFGSSTAKPTVSVTNSFGTTAQALSGVSTETMLYKTSTGTSMEETAISSSLGSTNNSRIILTTNTGDTPSNTGTQTVYSPSSALANGEAKMVAGLLKWDATNYSTGFLPAGPDYSAHTGTQYFTFKFQKASLSKFDLYLTSGTGITGCWIAVPTSTMDTTCPTTNGWMDMTQAVNGLGTIGTTGTGVTGTNGCAVSSSVIPVSSALSGSYTCTFNSYSTSSSTQNNEVYVRIALASGQSISTVSIGTATR